MNNATIRQQAAHWLIELQTEEITPELWGSFEEWLALSPVHRATYLSLERSWNYATVVCRAAFEAGWRPRGHIDHKTR